MGTVPRRVAAGFAAARIAAARLATARLTAPWLTAPRVAAARITVARQRYPPRAQLGTPRESLARMDAAAVRGGNGPEGPGRRHGSRAFHPQAEQPRRGGRWP